MEAIMLIGSRSYGIYLWHYPVMVLGTPIHEIGNPSYWRIFLQILLILMIAELSYRFIEMPIRKEGFRVYCQKYLICNKTSGEALLFHEKYQRLWFLFFCLYFSQA